MLSFSHAVEFVLDEEGGLVEDPNDPGGLTKYGISQRSYPDEDIKNLSRDRAIAIYQRDYWDNLPTLPPKLMFLAFDCSVNIGVHATVCLLQEVVGVKDDGIWGPKSKAALRKRYETETLDHFAAERARYYALLDALDDYYARGWMRRVMRGYREVLLYQSPTKQFSETNLDY